VLNIQSENVRSRRKQRVREAAMKAPVKLLFPLVFFIFPALFIVLLGPAAISIMRNLFNR
jgi:tight adherence protein C